MTITTTFMTEQKREETILSFLPMVKHIVGRMAINLPSLVDTEDLVEVGILGLISSIDSYQPKRGSSLKTYVYTRVKGSIIDELRKLSFYSREFYGKLKKLQKTFTSLQESLGRTPSIDELRDALEINESELGELLSALRSQKVVSLNHRDDSENGDELSSMLKCPRYEGPEQTAVKNELKEKLAKAIERLPERERMIIVLYYFKDMLLKEISKLLEISPARVSHLHSRALYRLNHALSKSR